MEKKKHKRHEQKKINERKEKKSLLSLLLAALALLATDILVLVPHPFPLVRLRGPQLADVGSKLAHDGLVRSRHVDRRRLVDLHLEPLGHLHVDRVRVAQVERQLVARDGRAVPDADHVERLGEARRGPDDHIGGQGADEAVCGVGGAGLNLFVDAEGAVVELFFFSCW